MFKKQKWDSADSNHVPHDLQSCALPGELESLTLSFQSTCKNRLFYDKKR